MLALLLSLTLAQPQQDTAAQVDTLVRAAMEERHIPGVAVAVVRGNRIVLRREYGLASVELEAPVRPGSVFLIASITKTFTALAIMQLAGEGRVQLDSSIAFYVGPVPEAWRNITVRHLLTHTGGLRDRFETGAGARFYMDYSTRQMRMAAESTPVDAPPGRRFQYSDQGYFLLGQVIEKASGTTYRQFLQERIFRPAGMTASTTLNQYELIKGRVPSYLLRQSRITPAQRSYHFSLVSHFGIMSTAEDLARYAQALLNGGLLNREALDRMWTPGVVDGGGAARIGGFAYGLGWFLEPFSGHRIVFHSGSTGTSLLLAPDDSLAVVVLTNLEQASGSDPGGLSRDIAQLYLPWLNWWDTPERPDPEPGFTRTVRQQLVRMAGGQVDSTVYSSAFWQSLRPTLAAQQNGLKQLGELKGLIHLSTEPMGNEWLVQWRGDYAEATLLVNAVRDRDGRIAQLSVRR
jgi:D-alanyl-D-alanine carboxypeptidase